MKQHGQIGSRKLDKEVQEAGSVTGKCISFCYNMYLDSGIAATQQGL